MPGTLVGVLPPVNTGFAELGRPLRQRHFGFRHDLHALALRRDARARLGLRPPKNEPAHKRLFGHRHGLKMKSLFRRAPKPIRIQARKGLNANRFRIWPVKGRGAS